MERADIERIAAEVCALYGSVRPWNSETDLARMARHFAGYLPDRVIAALEHWQTNHPDRAPKPAELLDAVRHATMPPPGLRPADQCSHPQPWAIVDERVEGVEPIAPLSKDHPVGTRVGMCIHCHTEIVRPPGRLLAESEHEERKRRMEEPRG